MSETIISLATLVGNFMRSIGLGCLSHTYGNAVTIILYRGIPFIEKEYSCMIIKPSVLGASLSGRRVIKNTPAVKFILDNQNISIEVYFRQDGAVHVQVYESQDVLDCHDGEKTPVFKLANITWNDVDLGWFPNLEKL
ncbi:TPA: hypothetical protein DEP94_00500 [Candidatus Nomurabacteria bacterium]|nr:hypothetical protein [Candidatus Nomurabacteria bacterium]